ncbi:hypothetical protein B4098_0629 [Heyndrickxia coagulans]|uniref:Uncharacterized protein n=1 Tax=Heyndrickxia coagulans TaxID=1398 RepID=A0A150K1F6_HEYCO|nr:hypothetical protein B4098_0629 [Heyndrickxia coagulans]
MSSFYTSTRGFGFHFTGHPAGAYKVYGLYFFSLEEVVFLS